MSREEILSVYTRLLEAWNSRDAGAFAALFTSTGSCVGFDGSQMNGPAEIESELRGVFANHPTASYVAKVREIRQLDPGVTLVRASVGMVPPGKAELNPAVNAIHGLVLVRDGEQPKIAILQNTPAAFHGRPHLAEALTRELTTVVNSGRVVMMD
jgi:uncharacterized protein (TIGR02246 family)